MHNKCIGLNGKLTLVGDRATNSLFSKSESAKVPNEHFCSQLI